MSTGKAIYDQKLKVQHFELLRQCNICILPYMAKLHLAPQISKILENQNVLKMEKP